jgi:hypothetical protein
MYPSADLRPTLSPSITRKILVKLAPTSLIQLLGIF